MPGGRERSGTAWIELERITREATEPNLLRALVEAPAEPPATLATGPPTLCTGALPCPVVKDIAATPMTTTAKAPPKNTAPRDMPRS
jgi:hypothetical protein